MTSGPLLSLELGIGLLVGFSILWTFLGWYWGKRARSLEGFMLAGRNVGIALGAATAVATWITSNTTMLAPQFALEMGLWGVLAYSTASFGLFLFAPMAQRIRELMPDAYTSAQFVRARFGNTAWIVFLIISLFYAITWMVSMGMAGGILIEALADIPYIYGMSAILFVCVAYTVTGGLYAVIGTDFIQSIIILLGVAIVGFAALDHVSLGEVYDNTLKYRPTLLWVMFPAAVMSFFNNLLFGIGEIFHSNVWWARALAMRKDVGKKAYICAGFLWLPVPIAAGFLAFAAPALGINIERPDMIGPVVAATLLGKAGAIVVFIIVFSSIASSVDSLLAATSQMLTIDVYQRMYPQSTIEQRRKIAARLIIIMGVLTWLVCLSQNGTLATVLFFAGPLVGSTSWPILAGLYWKQTHRNCVVAALIVGSGVGLWAYMTIGWYTGALVGTAASFVCTVLGSLIFPDRRFEWSDIAKAFAADKTPPAMETLQAKTSQASRA